MADYNLMKDMEKLKIGHAENKKELEYVKATTTRIEKKMDDFIDSAEKKFAPKWAADVLKYAGGVVATAVILAICSLILIK